MAVRFHEKQIRLSVYDLLDSGGSTRFLSSFPLPRRGMLGQKAHRRLQASRQKNSGMFQSEYRIQRELEYRGYHIIVQGKIDGLFRLKKRIEVEEIKSVLLNAKAFRTLKLTDCPAYIEQLLFYVYLLQDEFPGCEMKAFLVLVNLIDDKERVFPITYRREDVERLFFERLQAIIVQKELEDPIRSIRARQIAQLDLSLPEERPQQQRMISRVEECLVHGTHLMVSAPTGTGKTIAALFPAIQYAFPDQKKIYFATSKTTQQAMAVETVRILVRKGLKLRAVVLRAARKMCANDRFFCHEDYCPYALDYRRRVKESGLLEAFSDEAVILPERIYEKGVQNRLCPFDVSIDLAMRADVVIGDYNYIFDPAVHLYRLFMRKDYEDWILILDEAHNLYERGMAYLSPDLHRTEIRRLMELYKKRKTKIAKDLSGNLKQIDTMLEWMYAEGEIHNPDGQYYLPELFRESWDECFGRFESAYLRYVIHNIKTGTISTEDPLEQFYFNLRRFVRVLQYEDRAFVPFLDAREGGCLKILCCDPSVYLGERMERFSSVVAMSATFEPMEYYRKLLGFTPDRTVTLRLDSPFSSRQRKCIIIPGISTRFADRIKSFGPVAQVIKNVIGFMPGNYLVFFPSFEYLQNVYLFLGGIDSTVLIQKPDMKEEVRDSMLTQLREEKGPHLLLGVTGGIFAEGVDYPGQMAIGVILVSPSLPGLSIERELLKQYFDERYGMGMEYAYIYPGMSKVIQAAGRLIRSSEDRGILILIGERFTQEPFSDLLPTDWFKTTGDIVITDDYLQAVKEFWSEDKKFPEN